MPCPQAPKHPTAIISEHTKKGCVHWFDVDGSDPSISSQKARPYIIIGAYNPKSSRVLISPVSDREHYIETTTNQIKYPYHAQIDKCENIFLDKDSVVLLDQIYTISKRELCEEWYMGKIANDSLLDQALIYNFDMYESIFDVYKQLFDELSSQVKAQHVKKFSRR